MTEAELMAHDKIGPEVAARYLQNGTTAQEIRIRAQNGKCPFCMAEKPTGRRWVYRIVPGLLVQYKQGQLGLK